ncbi:helix-turn-helix transcriptional regulator [Lactobacillus sp. UCMA15818]|uniref:helix-turn-helix domain-containing protein n=1 Tax=Lactobacillus sp. UCMA15818 TaxID=2583394 RepID=UPI0025B2656A|nr:helix-turn-helix transcriptional regulator [Lactobacillus sp. UCMA15818]MDN2453104.1 helix-turn-helix transcriptional regulator [Lactobacillus sp. UCMA15818]
MNNIGPLIKKIRTDKNLTQKNVSIGVMSRSHLSELENGKYFPSYEKMLGLLQNLDISLMEFQTELGTNYSLEDRIYIETANRLSTEQKIVELANYLEQTFTADVAKKSIRLKIKRLNMLGLVELTQSNHITAENYQPIFNYLLSCKNWHEFEIRTLANSIFLADFEVAKILAGQFEEKAKKLNFTNYIDKVILFFSNLAELALRKEEYQLALIYAKNAQKKAYDNKKIYYLLVANVLVNLANLKVGKADEIYLQEITKNIAAFRMLAYSSIADNLQNLVDLILHTKYVS